MKSSPGFLATDGRCCVNLRIMATADLHMNILPYDYFADRANHRIGLARTASLIRARRATAANSLLFDIGDTLQGTPMGDLDALLHGTAPQRDIHPMIKAMNHLEYDAATVGNHDFNYGLPYLETVLNAARHPVTASNVHRKTSAAPVTLPVTADNTEAAQDKGEQPLFAPYLILPRTVHDVDGNPHQINFGILGFLPPQTPMWEAHLEGSISTLDIVDSARRWLPELRAKGADVVIALCHSGIGDGQHVSGNEHAAAALAALEGIDVVLAGHSHQLFPAEDASDTYAAFAEAPAHAVPRTASTPQPQPSQPGIDVGGGTLFGKPAVLPGSNGSHLGIVDVTLERTDSGWTIAEHRSELASIYCSGDNGSARPTVESCEFITDRVAKDHARVLKHIRQKVGHSDHRLHSFFARVMPDPVSGFVAAAQRRFLQKRLENGPYAGIPVLAAAAPFRAGGLGGPENYTDVAAGPLTLRNVADLYAFPNGLRAICLSGAAVIEWLECAVSAYHQIAPGSTDSPLLQRGFPSYNFEMLAPLEFCIDLSQPSRYDSAFQVVDPTAYRIRGLSYRGQPVGPHSRFVVAASDYRVIRLQDALRAAGLRQAEEPDIGDSPTMREVLLADLGARHLGQSRTRSHWSFCPMPGTSAVFQTTPRARDCLHELAGQRLDDLGDLPTGFASFRLHL